MNIEIKHFGDMEMDVEKVTLYCMAAKENSAFGRTHRRGAVVGLVYWNRSCRVWGTGTTIYEA